ncbi:hypothetical protein OIU76_003098 [Salix suchowensis]|nr:hypothetical protein OIU76_003098 [Salix suchowensis]
MFLARFSHNWAFNLRLFLPFFAKGFFKTLDFLILFLPLPEPLFGTLSLINFTFLLFLFTVNSSSPFKQSSLSSGVNSSSSSPSSSSGVNSSSSSPSSSSGVNSSSSSPSSSLIYSSSS